MHKFAFKYLKNQPAKGYIISSHKSHWYALFLFMFVPHKQSRTKCTFSNLF